MEPVITRVLTGLTVHELIITRNTINDLLENHSVKVDELGEAISARLRHALEGAQLTDLLDVAKMYKSQFEQLRGVGVLTIQEIEEVLEYYDLSFKSDQYSLNLS